MVIGDYSVDLVQTPVVPGIRAGLCPCLDIVGLCGCDRLCSAGLRGAKRYRGLHQPLGVPRPLRGRYNLYADGLVDNLPNEFLVRGADNVGFYPDCGIHGEREQGGFPVARIEKFSVFAPENFREQVLIDPGLTRDPARRISRAFTNHFCQGIGIPDADVLPDIGRRRGHCHCRHGYPAFLNRGSRDA